MIMENTIHSPEDLIKAIEEQNQWIKENIHLIPEETRQKVVENIDNYNARIKAAFEKELKRLKES